MSKKSSKTVKSSTFNQLSSNTKISKPNISSSSKNSEIFQITFGSLWILGVLIAIIYSNFISPNRDTSAPEPKKSYISQEEADWLREQYAYEEQQRIEKIKEDAWADMQYEQSIEDFANDYGNFSSPE